MKIPLPRRGFLGAAPVTVAGAQFAMPASAGTSVRITNVRTKSTTNAPEAIRPVYIDIPNSVLVDLRRRILATRWPERETVTDQSQGVKLAAIQDLVAYWGTSYDWQRAERKLNAVPQFMTTLDGLDISFAHIRSRHAGAMPLIVTHGWPGSIFELLDIVGPLTDPTRMGGARRTPSIWFCRRCRDMASRENRQERAGVPLGSRALGPC